MPRLKGLGYDFGDKVPLSPGVREYICGGDLILADVLAAGDDYELVFTAPQMPLTNF